MPQAVDQPLPAGRRGRDRRCSATQCRAAQYSAALPVHPSCTTTTTPYSVFRTLYRHFSHFCPSTRMFRFAAREGDRPEAPCLCRRPGLPPSYGAGIWVPTYRLPTPEVSAYRLLLRRYLHIDFLLRRYLWVHIDLPYLPTSSMRSTYSYLHHQQPSPAARTHIGLGRYLSVSAPLRSPSFPVAAAAAARTESPRGREAAYL